MGRVKIVNPGFFTTVQDSGRIGYQKYGIPEGGVMDMFSYRIANILVDNEEDEAVLEITMIGPNVEFLDSMTISITGGNLSPCINNEEVNMWESININKGDILSFNKLKSGCRAYIAFNGSINVNKFLNSRSTLTRSKWNSVLGSCLKSKDVLTILNSGTQENKKIIPKQYIMYYVNETNKHNVRVIIGPQYDHFTEGGIASFLNEEYIVTDKSDRMGVRLQGHIINHIHNGDIISEGITLGSIQVTNDGQPVIMMVDRQTTGGYAKIANVVSVDLYKIAQAKPGDKISFEAITLKQAHNELKERENIINNVKNNIKNI